MDNILSYIFLGNPIKEWLIAIAIMGGLLLAIQIVKKTALKRFKAWAAKTDGTLDDFISRQLNRIVVPFLRLLSFYAGLTYLTFNSTAEKWIKVLLLVVGVFLVLKLVTAGITYFINRSLQGYQNIEVKAKQARGIIIIINAVVWFTGFIFLLNNLGYNVTSVIAGLGIGGIAIALAAQAILGDLFSYFVIFFDKPFEIGDFINVDDKVGTIEYIGLKTTRLRTLGGEQLIFSNQDLTSSRVHNFKRMEKRRVVLQLGVVYDTSPEKLKLIPSLVSKIVTAQQDTIYDRGHFTGFGDFSLNFEFVYYVGSQDYMLYMNVKERINLAIFEVFLKEEIDFAFPTQTLIVSGTVKNHIFKQTVLEN